MITMDKLLKKSAIGDFWKPHDGNWRLCLPKGPIYHYTASVIAVENILSKGELWLSKSTVMNDSSEIKYGCELFKKVVEAEVVDKTLSKEIIDSFIKAIKDKIFGDLYILSFSENEKSRLLWDSYSQKTGFNIKFSNNFIQDIGQLPTIIGGPNINIVRKEEKFVVGAFKHSATANTVIYDKDKQKLIFKQVLEVLEVLVEENNIHNSLGVNECLSSIIDFIPFFKDDSLKDEEEYRLVVKIENADGIERDGKRQYLRLLQYYREFENKLFPYIILKMREKKYMINVCMGYCNCDELSEETLKDFVSTLSCPITISKCNIGLRR